MSFFGKYPPTGSGSGSGTVTEVDTGVGLNGGPITTTGTIALDIPVTIAHGGTNSIAALNNNRIIQSSVGAIVEASAITASRALASDANGIPVAATTTATELGYVNGVTSAIQTQLNGKQATLTIGNLTDAGTDGIVVTGGTGAVIGSGTSFAQHVADSTHNGYLSSTDWSTFNGKQASGNYITALTGGVTASGPGSAAATVVTNANLTGDVTSVGNATTLTNAPVIAKVLTGYTSGAGTVSAADSILQAIQKLNGNDATNANLTGPVTSVGNATAIADGALALAKLATTTAGFIPVGAVTTGIPTYVAVTGDVTLSSAGVTAIASGVIVNADINASAAIDGSKIVVASGATAGVVDGNAASWNGIKTFTTGAVIKGVTSGSAIAAGNVGESFLVNPSGDVTTPGVANVWTDASGWSQALTAGVYFVGYNVNVSCDGAGDARLVQGTTAIPGTVAYQASGIANMSRTGFLNVSGSVTLKLQTRRASGVGTWVVQGQAITGGLDDPDNESSMFAIRIA